MIERGDARLQDRSALFGALDALLWTELYPKTGCSILRRALKASAVRAGCGRD